MKRTLTVEQDWYDMRVTHPNTKKNFFKFLDAFDDVSGRLFEKSNLSLDVY